MDEILDLDTMGQAEAVREGQLGARKLIEAAKWGTGLAYARPWHSRKIGSLSAKENARCVI